MIKEFTYNNVYFDNGLINELISYLSSLSYYNISDRKVSDIKLLKYNPESLITRLYAMCLIFEDDIIVAYIMHKHIIEFLRMNRINKIKAILE